MKLRIFASHSFNRDGLKLSLADFRSVLSETAQEFSSLHKKEGLQCEIYFEDAEYGAPLPHSIRTNIQNCDIFLCDLSGLRPNVVYELGYAHGLGRELVLLRDNVGPVEIPTDLQDLLVGTYSSKETLKQKLIGRLSSLFSDMKNNGWPEPEAINTDSIWFEESPSRITIVCSSEPEKTRFADPKSNAYIFIDNLEDRDALVDVSMFLSRSFPNAGIQRQTAEGLEQDALESDIVVLGGPRSNSLTRDLLGLLEVQLEQEPDFMRITLGSGETARIDVLRNKNDLIVRDAGYLGIFSNPLRSGTRVILCIGSNVFGTHGSAKALDDSPQGQKNSNLLREVIASSAGEIFHSAQMIFHVPVMLNRKVPTPVVERGNIWIFKTERIK